MASSPQVTGATHFALSTKKQRYIELLRRVEAIGDAEGWQVRKTRGREWPP
jgi:hypothetical protein